MKERGRLAGLLALTALGIGGNYLSIPLFFESVDFVFGGIFLYVALELLGVTLASLIAVALSLHLLMIWGNLWYSAIFLLEFIVVSMLRRRGYNIIISDWLFWIALGIALLYLALSQIVGIEPKTSLTLSLKLAVNGLINVTIASLVVLVFKGLIQREEKVPFRQVVFVSLVIVATVPLFVKVIYDSKQEEKRMFTTIKQDMETITQAVKHQILYWLDIHFRAVEELANRLVIWGPENRDQLQKDTEAIRRAFKEFHACYIADKEATAITFYPEINPQGKYMIGTNFSYRPYYKKMKKTFRHVFTKVFVAKFALRPVVGISVPAVKGGEFIGYAYCGLNLEHARKIIEEFSIKEGVFITLLDFNRMVITSTRQDLSPMGVFETGDLKHLGGGLVLSVKEKKMYKVSEFEDAHFYREEKLRSDIPWSIVTEISIKPYKEAMFANLINHFFSIYILALFSFAFARGIGSMVYTPIAKLAGTVTSIARNIEKKPRITLPETNILDLALLTQSFEELANKTISYTEELKKMAYYDPLTNLPNRVLLRDRIENAIAFSRREGKKVAILFIDLDYFKTINDTLGHDVGDRILVQVARRLSSIFRDTDTVARFGGDEFVAVIPNVNDVGEVIALADRVLKLFETSFDANDEEVYLSASMGIALFPDNGPDPTTLIKNADMAMYKAKEEGKNNFAFFNEEMNQQAIEVLQIKSKLHRAIERDELSLHYQPIYTIDTNELIGFEALLRWDNPELGTVDPGKFINYLEELGLIRDVGESVLREVFERAKDWGDRYKVFLSVNISPKQFVDRRFLEKVGRLIKETGVNPAYVTLEITETSLMYNPDESANVLKKLKVQGFNIALDDFGTGYSSLAYLRRLPIDIIKIDISFTKSIVSSDVDRAIVSSIVNLSTSLGLHTLAEGVERRAQMDVLKGLGCDWAQGYFLGKPTDIEEAELLLTKEKGL